LWASALWVAIGARREARPLMKQMRDAPVQYEGESARAIPKSALPFLLAFASWSLLAMSIGAVFIALLAPQISKAAFNIVDSSISPDDAAQSFIVMTGLLLGLCYACWIIKWRFFSSGPTRPIGHIALRRHRAALWNLCLLSSALYLIAGWASLPARAVLDAGMQSYLQRGEIASLMPLTKSAPAK